MHRAKILKIRVVKWFSVVPMMLLAGLTVMGPAGVSLAQANGGQRAVVLPMGAKELPQWRFVGGPWDQDRAGIISPPHNLVDENLAFYSAKAYGDFDAEFDFRWDVGWTSAAFVFRAQDARHYYMVDFPVIGQQYRGEHFWATISKVDTRGWREGLHMQMVHGVSSTPGLWHKARVQVQGDEIRVWVDGRPLTAVRDTTYRKPGRIGLASYTSYGASAKSSFRNLRIRGQAVPPPPWDESIKPQRNWSVLSGAAGEGCSNVARAGNGDLLIASSDNRLFRSADKGRNWTLDRKPVPSWVGGLFHSAKGGRLETYACTEARPFKFHKAVSEDNGKSWSARKDLGNIVFPPKQPYAELVLTRLLKTKNGTLLLFGYTRSSDNIVIEVREHSGPMRFRLGYTRSSDNIVIEGRTYQLDPTPFGMNFCLRSTDDGKTWSAPVNLDGPPNDKEITNKEFCEVSAAQTKEGKILALVRPVSAPAMWETWSEDDGKTWTPLARGPFPLYAGNNSMLATRSGVLLVGGRFPGIAVQVSRDSGMTWQCYQIDNAMWANGAMFEVEPETVLYLYGGLNNPRELRYQILRVTPKGLEPVRGTK